jgi:hypothetical protein
MKSVPAQADGEEASHRNQQSEQHSFHPICPPLKSLDAPLLIAFLHLQVSTNES